MEERLAQIAYFMEESAASWAIEDTAYLVAPEYKRELRKLEEAEKLQKRAEEIKAAEDKILKAAVAMAENKPDNKQDANGKQDPNAKQDPTKQDPTKQNPNGQPDPNAKKDPSAKGNEKPDAEPKDNKDLAGKQEDVAKAVKSMALEAKDLNAADPAFGKMADKMDDASRNLFLAAAKMREGEMNKAADDIRRAQGNITDAMKDLKGVQQYGLEQAVDHAVQTAERILRNQHEVRGLTEAVGLKVDPAKKPDAAMQREIGKLTFRQGEIRADAEKLTTELSGLKDMTEKGGKPDTAKAVEAAHRGAERSQVVQKMTNAAVELDAARVRQAAGEQAKAEAGVQTVLDKLREAQGTLASDYKSELARAKFEADRITRDLNQLGSDPKPATEPGKEKGNEPGKEKANEKGNEPGKEKANEPGKEKGNEPGKEKANEPGKEKGNEKGKEKGNEKGNEKTGETTPMTSQERHDLGDQVARELASFVGHLENRQLVPEESRPLKTVAQNPDTLAQQVYADAEKRADLLRVMRRVSNKLEAEIEAKTEAERLRDFQREECPPQYRHMVNKYYEVLSQSGKE